MKWVLLIPLLFLISCSEQQATPSLSAQERQSLSKRTLKIEKKKAAQRKAQRKRMWLSSQGSNWPCPRLKRAAEMAKVGNVAFAIRCKKGIVGYRKKALFPSASASKALLLIAFLRSGGDVNQYRATLEDMIRYSDNEAADTIYYLLGDTTLDKVATNLGLRDTQFVGYWASILFSPADYARLFAALPRAVPKKRFALRLLKSITPEQRWGIPDAFSGDVYFKGGWRPEGSGWLTLQGALVKKSGQRASLAVFTLGFSQLDAQQIIKKVAKQLLSQN